MLECGSIIACGMHFPLYVACYVVQLHWHAMCFYDIGNSANPWHQTLDKTNTYLFMGSQKIMFPDKKRVVVKDLGPFIPANCTESRGGPNGPIPGPQNPPKPKKK